MGVHWIRVYEYYGGVLMLSSQPQCWLGDLGQFIFHVLYARGEGTRVDTASRVASSPPELMMNGPYQPRGSYQALVSSKTGLEDLVFFQISVF
jgi:hypothetical protein